MLKLSLILALTGNILGGPRVFAGVDPLEVQAQIYAMYLSRSALCTSPIEVFNNTSALLKNIAGGPAIGEVDNGSYRYDGTYPCVIFKMSEHIKFRPNLTSGSCTFDQSYDGHFCPSGYTVSNVDGSTSACTDAGDETVFLYLSTASTNTEVTTGVNPFAAPTSSNTNNGIKLTSAFSISGNTSGGLIIDLLGRIRSASGTCIFDMPRFAFSSP